MFDAKNDTILWEQTDAETLLSKYKAKDDEQNTFEVYVPVTLGELLDNDEDSIIDIVNEKIIDGYLICGVTLSPVAVVDEHVILDVYGELDYDPED